ncbi:MAG: hypothetical protein KDB27_17220 [Planctomycetales bacterium]|nr:hypothetical protein [Planctomycetales bacterium]
MRKLQRRWAFEQLEDRLNLSGMFEFDIDVDGSSRRPSEGEPVRTSSGGSVDIQLGTPVDIGTGADGDLTGPVLLTDGIYKINNIDTSEGPLCIHGDVEVKVFGQLVNGLRAHGTSSNSDCKQLATDNNLTETVVPELSVTVAWAGFQRQRIDVDLSSHTAGLDGGSFRFKSLMPHDSSVRVEANGGTDGGAGGTVSVKAGYSLNETFVVQKIEVNGGVGYRLGGGNGGTIEVSAANIKPSTLAFQANGGCSIRRFGCGGTPNEGERRGFAGGDGGSISLSGELTGQFDVQLSGGHGGSASGGHHGGTGGQPGRFGYVNDSDFSDHEVVINARGGHGGDGGYGIDCGPGGNGGNAGGVDGQPGRGGYGGSGPGCESRGADGQDGARSDLSWRPAPAPTAISPAPTTNLEDDELFEFLAREIAYSDDWREGDQLALPTVDAKSITVTEYEVHEVFRSSRVGFFALGLVSHSNNPILVIRGTDTDPPLAMITDVFDDLHPLGVGYGQFSWMQDSIFEWLDLTTLDCATYQCAPPSITGHSLGGAVSQLFAAYYTHRGESLDNVVTFNSPGIRKSDAALLGEVKRVRHYVMIGDVVSMAGEAFIEGDVTFANLSLPRRQLLNVANYVLTKHSTRLLIESHDRSVEDRHSEIQLQPAEPVDLWLNKDYFFYAEPEYFVYIYALQKVADQLADSLGLDGLSVSGSLLFRKTVEQYRQNLGRLLHAVKSLVLPDPNSDVVQVKFPKTKMLGFVEAKDLSVLLSQREGNPTVRISGQVSLSFGEANVEFSFDPVKQHFVEYSRNHGWLVHGRAEAHDIVMDLSVLPNPTGSEWGIPLVWLEFSNKDFDQPMPVPEPEEITCGQALPFGSTGDIEPKNPMSPVSDGWRIRGGATLHPPVGPELIVGVGFQNSEPDYLQVALDDLELPLGPIAIQCLSGYVDHFATVGLPTTLGAQVGFTVGPQIPVPLPDWLGGPREIEILAVDLEGRAYGQDGYGFMDAFMNLKLMHETKSGFSVGSGTMDGRLLWDGTRKSVSLTANGHFELLGGLASVDGSVISNDNDFKADLRGRVGIPFLPFGKGAGRVLIQNTNDGNRANDYILLHATFSFWKTFTVGRQIFFDGSVVSLNDKTEAEVSTIINSTTVTHTVNIPSNAKDSLLTVGTDAMQVPDLQLVMPNGRVYNVHNPGPDAPFEFIEGIPTDSGIVLGISDPMAGEWSLQYAGQTPREVHVLLDDDTRGILFYPLETVEHDSFTVHRLPFSTKGFPSPTSVDFYAENIASGDRQWLGSYKIADSDGWISFLDSQLFQSGYDLVAELRDGTYLSVRRWSDVLNPLKPGDANGDGVFNSSDLVAAFIAGEFEDDIPGNSTFEEGDWNGDGDFTTADLVTAFQHNTYSSNARLASVASAIDQVFYFCQSSDYEDGFVPTDSETSVDDVQTAIKTKLRSVI